ncbi:MAG: metallophosphoesterase [Pedobacter sp.]
MQIITRKIVLSACVLTLIASTAFAAPWKFGVMSDTQWPNSPDGKNPNVAVNVIRHLNQEFINKGVKFVVQVGDLTDGGSNSQLDTRATFTQDLYNAGIGFYPLRGNHESSKAGALEFQRIFPQTQTGVNNQTPTDAMVTSTIYGAQPNSNSTFSVGSNFMSEPGYEGLTYSFDYDNARFVLIDQFTKPSGTSHSNLDQNDINWIGGRFSSKPTNTHAFSFAHKGLITENHNDNLFNSTNPDSSSSTTWPLTNSFMSYLANSGVRYHLGGHDHIHNRAIITSPDGASKVQNIITSSNSYKFYIPPTNVTSQTWRTRELQIAQELLTVGYYIFTVDGPKVTVDHYASPNGCNGDCNETYDVIPYDFTKHESFGYSLNGKEIVVPHGGSYALTDDTTKAVANGETGYLGTTAAILNGANSSTGKDYSNRPLAKTVDTGWSPAASGHASDILTLWGLTDSLATDFSDLGNSNMHYKYVVPNTNRTDTYALSMTYNDARFKGGVFGLSARDENGNWINAIIGNDSSSVAMFVNGPYNSSYPLGTYGVDPATKTAWAVVNHSSDFAVAPLATNDVTSQINATTSTFVYNRATRLYTGKLTITNTGSAINTPVAVALNGLTSGVTLNNALGQYNSAPYAAITNSGLASGASITIPLSFSNPNNAKINFTPVTFQE